MGDFSDILNKINALKSFDTKAELSQIVDDNNRALVHEMQEQLIEGKDVTGEVRNDSYRPFTKAYKRQFGRGPGAIIDHVTFYMSGTLNASLYYVRNGETFTFQSSQPTYDKMLDRIGAPNFALDPDNCADFANNTVLPAFKNEFKSKTGLEL